MPCWPDVWDSVRKELPIVEVYGSVIAYMSLTALLLWAPKIERRRLRLTSRVLGGLAVIPLLFFLPVFLFGIALTSGEPPARTRAVTSMNGDEATLIYHAGFLGRDYTEVKLKRVGCCQHKSVFWHSGPSYFDDPQLEWLDGKHLAIVFHSRPDDLNHCEEQFANIAISCTRLIWPQAANNP